MRDKWRTAALVMAALGFVAVFLTAYSNPFMEASFEGVLLRALLNGAIWFGIVYLVHLVIRFLAFVWRKATGAGRRSE